MAALINSIVIPQPLQGYVFARDVILCNMPVASNLQGTGNKELEPPGHLKGSKNLLNKPKLGPTLPSLTYLPNETQSAFKLSCSSPLDSSPFNTLAFFVCLAILNRPPQWQASCRSFRRNRHSPSRYQVRDLQRIMAIHKGLVLTLKAGQKPVEGETPIRRIPAAIPDLIAKPEPNISTTYELVRESVKKYGNAKAIGSRKLVRTHQETKKVKKMVDGEEREVDKS